MWPYWMLFLLPAAAALQIDRPFASASPATRKRFSVGWLTAAIALTLMIGYRFEVGGDWESYFDFFLNAQGAAFMDVLAMSDPGYHVLNWISAELDLGVYGVNLVGAAVFAIGLSRFCVSLPRPWLALAVAVPYLVIVVGMGYSRQAIALGCAMIGLVSLHKKSTLWFMIWLLVGATFHKTAILLLPIAGLANAKDRYWTILWVCAVTVAAYVLLLQDSVETLYVNYVEAQYQSEGTLIRLVMNALPAVLLLLRSHRFTGLGSELTLWRLFALISLALLLIFFFTSASTAVDRVALYMLPLQLMVFSHAPSVLGVPNKRNLDCVVLILAYYAAVLFVWLEFANHAQFWLPYRFYPLDSLP